MVCAGVFVGAAFFTGNDAFAQRDRKDNPYTKKEIGTIAPPASLSQGFWLKGDLHVHTVHSTDSRDSVTNTMKKTLGYARSVGMGFIAITDHDNHVRGDIAHNTWADPDFKSDSLILLYGAEWTTTRGHGNVFAAKPYNHQKLYDVRDQRDVLIGSVKKELGVHLSANHPIGKDHFGFSYDMVNSIEVWNSAVWPKNVEAIMIWDDMLSSGRKLTGRGGSDTHRGFSDNPAEDTPENKRVRYNYIGTPTTWVFVKERTGQAVVDALTNGRVSVSSNPYGPRVEFSADLDNDGKMDLMMGDNTKSTGKPVKFRVQLAGNTVPGGKYKVNVFKNSSNLWKSLDLTDGNGLFAEFTDMPSDENRTYYRVTIEGPVTPYPQVSESMKLSGNMVGLSNPIFFNFDPNF
ncbi:CehA/McbA family metallohydrolase [Dyadobacter sp. CY345]|uniref:CehA/McbA family metallohydrolase n=1 Tax=Dyadobacter sp. CY345 TaxID=2909335 RepID=UPI001F395F4D|nr:CehA/McbA family metallohydrolase [Dyadobacter sp. CY345]MCF2446768.1 CehA/McbA family metallohydrolase [Dyadobacter sp. CY345]